VKNKKPQPPARNDYTLEWSEHEFEPCNGTVEHPLWDDVRAIIIHLMQGDEITGFVILSRGEQDYFQCARAEGGLIAEYRDPTNHNHFELAAGVLPMANVLEIAKVWFDDPTAIGGLDVWTPLEF
jgi:hypothetical protein